jgi:hypothetical protein
MASNAKKKTTMAKLNREAKLREKRIEKQVRKDARKRAAAAEAEAPETAPADEDGPAVEHAGPQAGLL